MGGYTGGSHAIGYSIAAPSSGSIYVTGEYKGIVDFDPGLDTFNLNPVGYTDMYIIKLRPCTENYSTDIITACHSYTWMDGIAYSSSNDRATHTLTNAAGCDSIVILDLTIANSSTGNDEQTACDSYLWIDSNTYVSSNNTVTHVLANSSGCDSIITLDLNLIQSTISVTKPRICNGSFYTSPSGNHEWTSGGSYLDTIINFVGCDSVITIILEVDTVNASVHLIGTTFIANASNATYQWLDCNNGFAIINGATSQSFNSTDNGTYAVELSRNGCADTSACYSITGVNVIENDFRSSLTVYPNPTAGKVTIDLGKIYDEVAVTVSNIIGKVIFNQHFMSIERKHFEISGAAGLYLIEIRTSIGKSATLKVFKE